MNAALEFYTEHESELLLAVVFSILLPAAGFIARLLLRRRATHRDLTEAVRLADRFRDEGLFEKALQKYGECLSLLRQRRPWAAYAHVRLHQGICLLELADRGQSPLAKAKEALPAIEDAAHMYMTKRITDRSVSSLQELAWAYFTIGKLIDPEVNYSKSFSLNAVALRLAESFGNKQQRATTLNAIGLLFYRLSDLGNPLDCINKALATYTKAISDLETVEQDPDLWSDVNSNIGNALVKKLELGIDPDAGAAALAHYNEALRGNRHSTSKLGYTPKYHLNISILYQLLAKRKIEQSVGAHFLDLALQNVLLAKQAIKQASQSDHYWTILMEEANILTCLTVLSGKYNCFSKPESLYKEILAGVSANENRSLVAATYTNMAMMYMRWSYLSGNKDMAVESLRNSRSSLHYAFGSSGVTTIASTVLNITYATFLIAMFSSDITGIMRAFNMQAELLPLVGCNSPRERAYLDELVHSILGHSERILLECGIGEKPPDER